MFSLSKPSDIAIRDFLARQTQSRLSYQAVGASADGSTPFGYAVDHARILLGHGDQVWQRAVNAIDSWQMFNMSWVQLCWPNVPITKGTNVAILIHHFGFYSLSAAQIVYTINENAAPIRRYGFAYGTLMDHGESGEERFSVEWSSQDNSVWYDLFAFSRPRVLAARMGYPVARWLQSRFREASKAAMARAAAAPQTTE